VVRGYPGPGPGRCHNAVVVACREVDPRTHFMRPGDDLAVVCFRAERQRGLARGFRGMPVACVVLDASHEQGHPSGENQDFAVLP
jgi:hypothetical protein